MASQRTIPTDEVVYEFAPEMTPATTLHAGESATVHTRDSLDGAIQSDDDLLTDVPREVNAATGPIEIPEASPGDVLAVELEAIRPAEERGRVLTIPNFGLLHDDEAIEEPRTKITPVDGEVIRFDDLEVPLDICIGTIGVAPESDAHSTLVPHDHGGNLDTTDLRAGNAVYFPVFQPGAMLAVGDCKAAMADGEHCGTGAEIAAEIDLTVDVISSPSPSPSLSRPLLETPDAWKPLASADTLEAACRLANTDAIDLLAAEHGFDETEAHMFSSLVCDLEISQVVDPLVTVRNAIPKAYLSSPFER
ncbi:acetamidase/formamidase family protein [Haloferacaceae archaeon DSL9]